MTLQLVVLPDVYFDQRLGAVHSQHQSKFGFSIFLVKKARKRGISQKISTQKSQLLIQFHFGIKTLDQCSCFTAINCLASSSFFERFCIKNVEKSHFDKHLECPEPKACQNIQQLPICDTNANNLKLHKPRFQSIRNGAVRKLRHRKRGQRRLHQGIRARGIETFMRGGRVSNIIQIGDG